jgi:hypothetical protein
MIIDGMYQDGKLSMALSGVLDHHAARDAMRKLT